MQKGGQTWMEQPKSKPAMFVPTIRRQSVKDLSLYSKDQYTPNCTLVAFPARSDKDNIRVGAAMADPTITKVANRKDADMMDILRC